MSIVEDSLFPLTTTFRAFTTYRSDHTTSANILAPIAIQIAADVFAICTQNSGCSSKRLSLSIAVGSTPVSTADASVNRTQVSPSSLTSAGSALQSDKNRSPAVSQCWASPLSSVTPKARSTSSMANISSPSPPRPTLFGGTFLMSRRYNYLYSSQRPQSTHLRSFRERWRTPESCRSIDYRIRSGIMAEIGPRADCLLSDR